MFEERSGEETSDRAGETVSVMAGRERRGNQAKMLDVGRNVLFSKKEKVGGGEGVGQQTCSVG